MGRTKGNTPGARKRFKRSKTGKVQVVTWNIQKVNQTKCKDHGAKITAHLEDSTTRGTPFVIGILENKSKPEEVEHLLKQVRPKRGRPAPQTGSISMGGASTVVENLVFSAGNGARVRSAMQWTKWQEPFNAKTKKMDIAKREESRSTHPMKKRERTEQVSERSIQGIQHPDASHFRSPVLLEVETDQSPRPFKILMLHAPGPQGKEVGQDPYAETYVKSVCEEAHKDGIDGVQGDLNIYSPLSSCGGYRDATEGCGGTTQNTTGRVSRLDRSMLGPGVRGEAAVNRKGVSTDVSDHFSLSCTVTVGDHQTGDSDRMDDE